MELLERACELDELGELLGRARTGSGGVAVVVGSAGIGKTRLLEAACQDAVGQDFRVLSARADDLERDFPYGVVRQLLGRVVEDDPALLDGTAAFARSVFEGPGESASPETVLHGLHRFVLALVEQGPLLLAVDDAHWADTPSLQFLRYLSRRLDVARLVVIATTRTGETGAQADLLLRLQADNPVISPRPLSAPGTAALVRSFLGAAASEELCLACHATTGGNPFLVRELTGALQADGGSADAERVRALVPEAVTRYVLVRLSRIGAEASDLAAAVAVLGAGADLRAAATLAELDEHVAAAALDELVAADILRPSLPLEFVHPLLRESVYHDSGPGRRALAHARAARMLAAAGAPPERVAAQLLLCEPAGSEQAVETLRAAAAVAMGRGAPQVAARYLGRALAEPPTPATESELLLERGIAESRAGSLAARESLEAALRLTEQPVARAKIVEELAAFLHVRGEHDQAAAALDGAIEALGAGDLALRFSLEAEAAVEAVTALDARRRLSGRMAALRARGPELMRTPEACPLLALMAFELSQTDGSAAVVVACAERAFADARLRFRPGPLVPIGTIALISAGRLRAAEAILDAAISDARSRGAASELAHRLAVRAIARIRLGVTGAVEADVRESLDLMPAESDVLRPVKVAQLAEVLIARGALADAERLFGGTELGGHDPDTILFQAVRLAHAGLRELQGRTRDALDELTLHGRWAHAWGCANPGLWPWRARAALLHRALGEHEQARALAAQELAAARAFGAPHTLGAALRAAGLVEEQPEIELLRESVAVLNEAETRPELARSLVELGSALRRRGHRRDARDPLRRGAALAAECGHDVLAEHARSELLASGAARTQAEGEPLTASETRVADLAADGLTNRAIAQQLFLSPKTVEMHLSRVYRKLGIGSRRELERAKSRV